MASARGVHGATRVAITGGTQGLGFAVARRLLLEGAPGVAICGRDAERGARAVARLEEEVAAARREEPSRWPAASEEASIVFVRADLTDAAQATRFIEEAVERLGGVNALVNNAGLAQRGGLLDTDPETWDHLMALNLRAPFLTMQAAVRHMKGRGVAGAIVNVISMVAHCGQSYLTPYSAAKGGLATLTKNVAAAFVADRIRCNGVLTGWMETEGEAEIQRRYHNAGDDWAERAAATLPMGQLVKPDQLAGLISYMVSPEAGVMTGALVDYDQVVVGAYPE